MPVTSGRVIDYAVGAGGRLDVLPERYLDAVASAVTRAHPSNVPREVLWQLKSGRFKLSVNPRVANATTLELQEMFTNHTRCWRARTRRLALKRQT